MSIYDIVFNDMKEAFQSGVIHTDHGLEWEVPAWQGYGVCSWSTEGFNMKVRAHRVAWMIENGSIPEGHIVDHDPACPKTCVTAEHLQAISISDHTKLGWERGELNGGWGTKRERVHPPKPAPFMWKKERSCKNCGTPFMPTNATNLHCSRECHCSYKEALRKPRRNPRPDYVDCVWCQSQFSPKRKDSRFCTDKCSNDFYNNRKKVRKEGVDVMP